MNRSEIEHLNIICKGNDQLKIISKICGEKLGSGAYRDVYVLKQNKNYVVKIERHPHEGAFANATEWRNYINHKEFKWLVAWLAPCEMITEDGSILIQRRVTHGPRKDYPKHIPVMLTDLKVSNFGWIGKKFVCCDYSYMTVLYVKVNGKRLKYAKWWGKAKK